MTDTPKLKPVPIEEQTLLHIPLHLVRPDPCQPRQEYTEEELDLLAERIDSTKGITKPIDVTIDPDNPNSYLIEDGEMRWVIYNTRRNEDSIPARLLTENAINQDRLMRQLMANIGNTPMKLLDIAQALHDWKTATEPHRSNKETARTFGMAETKVSRLFKLLDAPKIIQNTSLEVTNINTLSSMIQLHKLDAVAFHGALAEFTSENFDQNGEKFWRIALKQSQEPRQLDTSNDDGHMTESRNQPQVRDPARSISEDASIKSESAVGTNLEDSESAVNPFPPETSSNADSTLNHSTPSTPIGGCVLTGFSSFEQGQATVLQLRFQDDKTGVTASNDYIVNKETLIDELISQLHALKAQSFV